MRRILAITAMTLVAGTYPFPGDGAAAGQAAAADEVTLKGMVLNQVHTGEKENSVFVYALDGPPEIKAEFDRIMTEYYPEKGLDADAARKLQDQFTARLKYYIAGPLADKLCKDATYGAREVKAVTGAIYEKDGKKWITASKCEGTKYQYPAIMLAPDKPFVMPDKEALILKVNDELSLTCIHVAPGKFFMGEPYYMCPHWQEDPPHVVTLTKGYSMAECPVTWEMYDAVMGVATPATDPMFTGPKAPANVSCQNIQEFCRRLSEKSGRKVRLPTAAEWDFAARVGTSNPPFAQKYKDRESDATKAVKSKQPNAWGFYDMTSTGWERVGDSSSVLDRQETVDPQHLPPEDTGQADKNHVHGHFGKGCAGYHIGEIEYIHSTPSPPKTYPGVLRFRVVVEADAATAK
ncbi:MAG: SUMF1/EgtB/PvdO family nonheme iron enzyme [Planctomycetota bacterium]|nr:SUMF1/EgtB/PvdO family nonheme iron enzyme [Planctomycetota bacterium]